jgi:2-aminoadipate transaminase
MRDTSLWMRAGIGRSVSVTRKLAAGLEDLKRIATERGLRIHHLGGGYPHPEVCDPRGFVRQRQRYFEACAEAEPGGGEGLSAALRGAFAYTDTLGPEATRCVFARIYGRDWGVKLDPARLVATLGATGGISLTCSVFERLGVPLAFITDAPTYPGFLARAQLHPNTEIYSVEMDEEGPVVEVMREQIRRARENGRLVPFYYTIPDGHNPGGFSFSQRRRVQLLELMRDEDLLILEDAAYLYMSYCGSENRAQPFFAMDPERTIHLFTASKLGLPGPRVGFAYSETSLPSETGSRLAFSDLLLDEASGAYLFQNPETLRGFEALLHDEELNERDSLWSLASKKTVVYRENRDLLLGIFEQHLGRHRDQFSWTNPQGGFFTVFSFRKGAISTGDSFVQRLMERYGIVVVPMHHFFPRDARQRNAEAGLDQLRLSFSFTEGCGRDRVREIRSAAAAFCNAVLYESGLRESPEPDR